MHKLVKKIHKLNLKDRAYVNEAIRVLSERMTDRIIKPIDKKIK